MKQVKTHFILLDRYEQYIKELRPETVAQKALNSDKLSRFSLSHGLWMINKMRQPSFKPLTTVSAWISWIQAIMYFNNLINPDHEKDITRDMLKQYSENGE